MRWRNPSDLIGIFGALATIIMGSITILVSVQLVERGGAPPKRVQATTYGTTNPLDDLSRPGSNFSISIQHHRRRLRNVRVTQAKLINVGSAPILPDEIIEPFALEVSAPWQIVNVVTSIDDAKRGPRFEWKKRSASVFEAAPTLLNPGDHVNATVYVTRPPRSPEVEEPTLKWSARVVNLAEIESPPNNDISDSLSRSLPVQIFIWGWGVPFSIGCFIIYFGLTTLLMIKAHLIRATEPLSYAKLVMASVVNVAAAATGTIYLFGAPEFHRPLSAHWYNAPPLVCNALILLVLWHLSRPHRDARHRSGKTHAAPAPETPAS